MNQAAKILIVDDNPLNGKLLAAELSTLPERYEMVMAGNGLEGLKKATSELPDLILLDVMMPGMDGYELCGKLKSHKLTKNIPVIFQSAKTEDLDESIGLDLGAVDYIKKPFCRSNVITKVKTHLALKQYRDQLEEEVQKRTLELLTANARMKLEIAERRQLEKSLRASEQRYRLLTENVADGVGIIQDGRLAFVNPALASIFGSTEEALLGTDPSGFFQGNYRDAITEMLVTTRKDTPHQRIQVLHRRGGGRETWLEFIPSAIEWAERLAVLVAVRDITVDKVREMAAETVTKDLQQENNRLKGSISERYKFRDIIGKSQVMQEVYEKIIIATAVDANVVVYGESGTGKDLIARVIHEMSERSGKKLVPVNCGAVPETLFESEFFGHRKGAFTGAHADKHGFFDLADGGILFLDEVGELTLNMQVKLLRAIDGGGFTPVGGTENRKTDIRIIAATNKPLKTMVEKGLMREDFYYRLHVIPITVPALRDRREDISLLIDHYLHSQRGGKAIPLPGKIMEALLCYDWPGNVRELHNVLHRYLVMGNLDFPGVSSSRNINNVSVSEVNAVMFDCGQGRLKLDTAIEHLEREFVSKALAKNGWNRSDTAKELGIARKTLFRKMKDFGLGKTRNG